MIANPDNFKASSSKGPKVVIIGAGSAFFGRQTICGMVTRPALNRGCLALADTDETKLCWMQSIAKRAVDAAGVALKIEASTDYRSLLKRADFVILAFAVEGVSLRDVDSDISMRHGKPKFSMKSGNVRRHEAGLVELPQWVLLFPGVFCWFDFLDSFS